MRLSWSPGECGSALTTACSAEDDVVVDSVLCGVLAPSDPALAAGSAESTLTLIASDAVLSPVAYVLSVMTRTTDTEVSVSLCVLSHLSLSMTGSWSSVCFWETVFLSAECLLVRGGATTGISTSSPLGWSSEA